FFPSTINLQPSIQSLIINYNRLSLSLRLSYLISLSTEDFIPTKKYQAVLMLPIGVQLKLICQLSKSRWKRNCVSVTPLFLKSYPEETPTVHRGASSILVLIIKDWLEISFCRWLLPYVMVYAKRTSHGML